MGGTGVSRWGGLLMKYRYVLLLLLAGTALLLMPGGSGGEAESGGTEAEARLEAVLSEIEGVGRVGALYSESGVVIVCEGAGSSAVRLDVTDAVASVGKQVLPAAITLAVAESITLPEGMSYEDLDTTVFNETIELLDEQKPEEAKQSFLAAVDTFASESLDTEIDEETRAEIEDIYDEAIGLMTVDGEFSFARLPDAAQVLLDKYSGGQASLPGVRARGAREYTAGFAEGEAESGDSLLEIREDPGRYVDELDDETVALLMQGCLIAAVAMIALASVWLILALFALVHIFTPNKKVAMWYVKLLGLLPFLLFVALPLLALAVLPAFVPSMPAIAAAFLGMTVVAAVCYVALWLISIFWCHPIRERIEAAREKQAYAAREAREAN